MWECFLHRVIFIVYNGTAPCQVFWSEPLLIDLRSRCKDRQFVCGSGGYNAGLNAGNEVMAIII
jgi:hypothetical protein